MQALADSWLFWVALIVALVVVYLLPTITAVIRGTDHLVLVFLVNLIGAPSGIGWFAAMILAFGPRRLPPPRSWPGRPEPMQWPAGTWDARRQEEGSKARGMTVTVASMGGQEDHRADHAAYVAAVCRSIEARDIRVTDVQVRTSEDGRREASLALRPDEDAFTERVPAEATANWNEDNGWSLQLAEGSSATQVHKGLSVLPDPEDVAAWAVVLLTHPELTPDRADHPFRDHSVADPGFEAELSSYTPAT